MNIWRTEIAAVVLGGSLLCGVNACDTGSADGDPQLRACETSEDSEARFPFRVDGASIRICGSGRVWVRDERRDQAEVETTLRMNASGELRDERDRVVLGVTTNESSLSPVRVPLDVEPRRTEHVEFGANVDLSGVLPVGIPFDPLDPWATSDLQTSLTIFDPLGQPVDVVLFFNQTGLGTWSATSMSVANPHGHLVSMGEATLRFTEDGALESVSGATFDAPWPNDTDQTWELHLGDPIDEGGTGMRGTTSLESGFGIREVEQDGQEGGELFDLELSRRGELTALYSNGELRSFWILDGLEGWLEPVS